jgi:hypothetical protein
VTVLKIVELFRFPPWAGWHRCFLRHPFVVSLTYVPPRSRLASAAGGRKSRQCFQTLLRWRLPFGDGPGQAPSMRAHPDLLRLQQPARRVLPHRSRPQERHDDQPRGRRGRDQGAGARRPPGPLRCQDHRVSARAPALRPTRVRAVLGRRRGACCRATSSTTTSS